jgi:putative transposase
VIRTPVRAPNTNAYIERWVGTVRRECLDRLLIFSRRQLERILRVYIHHYNAKRPHRALGLQTPDPPPTGAMPTQRRSKAIPIRRQDLLGGLIHGYEPAAAA